MKMADMTKVSEWYDIDSNKWFMVFECYEENYIKWEKETREMEAPTKVEFIDENGKLRGVCYKLEWVWHGGLLHIAIGVGDAFLENYFL